MPNNTDATEDRLTIPADISDAEREFADDVEAHFGGRWGRHVARVDADMEEVGS
jgi:hypothetical protein